MPQQLRQVTNVGQMGSCSIAQDANVLLVCLMHWSPWLVLTLITAGDAIGYTVMRWWCYGRHVYYH